MTARHRLSRKGVAALPTALTEAQFMRQVTELAELYGWSWAHFRPAMTSKGWRTPVSGPLGAGWPDLVLIRKRRIVFAELKSDGGRVLKVQNETLDRLLTVEHYAYHGCGCPDATDVRVELWRPVDWALIQETLSERRAA
jgi:hypothetical protein